MLVHVSLPTTPCKYARVCVCVRVCIYMYIYIYKRGSCTSSLLNIPHMLGCVCVCVRVYIWLYISINKARARLHCQQHLVNMVCVCVCVRACICMYINIYKQGSCTSSLSTILHTCAQIYVGVYIYIYTEKESGKEREGGVGICRVLQSKYWHKVCARQSLCSSRRERERERERESYV